MEVDGAAYVWASVLIMLVLIFLSYDDIIKYLIRDIEQKVALCPSLWKDNKYEPISNLLENLQQSSKIPKHDVLASSFSIMFKSLIESIKPAVQNVESQVFTTSLWSSNFLLLF